jgi:N-sulfoglucosamine sulfohydrolase
VGARAVGRVALTVVGLFLLAAIGAARQPAARPDLLVIIADDWSWPDAAAAGHPVIRTPAFDRVAREGVLFRHAFAAAPSCSASRAALLTGQAPHRLGEGANLWSRLRPEFVTYPDRLEQAGYTVGLVGKGWGPGTLDGTGRTRNPAGPPVESFEAFLERLPADSAFAFWIGPSDPHRPYEPGLAGRSGLSSAAQRVPETLPDVPAVRQDLADYAAEVERFDGTVAAALATLEARGRLDRTLVVVTSDNGRPFPRDKANLYDGGTRVPLAIRWPARIRAGRVVDAFVSLTDLAPTMLAAAGLAPDPAMTGQSLIPLLNGEPQRDRDRVYVERERHAQVRAGNLGYPSRGVRTKDHLYIRNFAPERWPAGDPTMREAVGPFGDVDHGPAKDFILAYRDDPAIAPFYARAFARRPAEELYALATDPDQLINVVDREEHRPALASLRASLAAWMRDTGDPRATGGEDVFSGYPYFGPATPWPGGR